MRSKNIRFYNIFFSYNFVFYQFIFLKMKIIIILGKLFKFSNILRSELIRLLLYIIKKEILNNIDFKFLFFLLM